MKDKHSKLRFFFLVPTCYSHGIAVVESPLAAGADVNADPADEYGRTALQAAVEGGHLKIVKRLQIAGALERRPTNITQ
jgi:ankyrin repeat protein